MSDDYFAKFPLLTYSNTVCVDITRRTIIANTVQQDVFAYFPYQARAKDRADSIADNYYGDPSYDWLVYLSNNTTDPYYSLPLDEITFENYLTAKYGSVVAAQQLILWWEMNWYANTDEQISTSYYQTNLTEPLKKYYQAIYGDDTVVLYYQRLRADWRVSTNQIWYFEIEDTNGSFQIGEQVNLTYNSQTIANAYVTFSNSSQVTVQHVLGNTQPVITTTQKFGLFQWWGDLSGGSTGALPVLTGANSGANATVLQSVNVANNIPIDEQVYWSPTYAFDYENSVNQSRKFMRLVDSKYTLSISQKLRKSLQQ